ncbi:hypothetical protein ACIPRI_18940 [Variovorax sp. LARHSF232]
MDASQLFGTIIRILNQPVFPPRGHAAHAPVRQAHTRARPAAALTNLAPLTVTPMPAPARAPTPTNTLAMRTLEEVRTDLARLREQAKQRQAASAQARRDQAFAPTDFMDFGGARPAGGRPATPAAGSGFAPTDFQEMGTAKPS